MMSSLCPAPAAPCAVYSTAAEEKSPHPTSVCLKLKIYHCLDRSKLGDNIFADKRKLWKNCIYLKFTNIVLPVKMR